GTPAVTTLGMGVPQMQEIASIIKLVLAHTSPSVIIKGAKAGQVSKAKADTDAKAAQEARERVQALLGQFVLYPELDLELLQEYGR
ncbi:MAG: glycine hydroxymethyltransferase, partial [Sphaerochaetaceae bacterium]|nr:glycine hydroxymethyltransferase [Sphaerochaetaceae bacterium]